MAPTPESTGMPEHRRALLLRAAAAEFARHGYTSASLNRIIRTSGLSKSSFYYFIGSKRALFDLVVTETGRSLASRLDIPTPRELADDFWPRIERLAQTLAAVGRDEPWLAELGRVFHLPDAPREPGSALATAWERIDAWLEATIAVGRSAGAIRGDLPAGLQARVALAVLEAMDEWSLHNLDNLGAAEREVLARSQTDAVRRLLAP